MVLQEKSSRIVENNQLNDIQIEHSNLRKIIENINWDSDLNTSNYSLSSKHIKTHAVTTNSTNTCEQEMYDIIDDETLYMLHSAFSFSDDYDRGFRIGPESNEPYPIFQVAFSVPELFKATNWRNFNDIFPIEQDNERDIPIIDDVTFRVTESEHIDSEDFVSPIQASSRYNADDVAEEIEQRINVSCNLLQKLQERLNSTLSVMQSNRCIRTATNAINNTTEK